MTSGVIMRARSERYSGEVLGLGEQRPDFFASDRALAPAWPGLLLPATEARRSGRSGSPRSSARASKTTGSAG
jgi:hypothetical protein